MFILDILDGKKTYIGIAATALGLALSVDISEGDLSLVLGEAESIITSIGLIVATLGRIFSKRV